MNFEFLYTVIGGIIGGALGVYIGFKSKVWEKIWEKRLEAYMSFTAITALLPKYPKNDNVNWADIFQLSIEFRDWYFKGNGLVTSIGFRNEYFDLQKYIMEHPDAKRYNMEKLKDDEYEYFRERCSKLRTLMAKELESRELPFWRISSKENQA